ncbi:MAG TPA: DinB family protein [Candidatus Dormibacteraeota bacterium]|nr:DinB family protein [Candidatus Dormibacteraeota bacterium]
MIDFAPVRTKERSLDDIAEGLTRDDLASLASEMCDVFLELIADAHDSDVTFVPEDPAANDTFAATAEEVNMPWTLGHVIVHWTASSEESAALALTLARGTDVSGRSRYEVPWQEVTEAAFLRERIEESRRMQLAMLGAWPDTPHLEKTYSPREGARPMNAVVRFLGGLNHADAHRDQVRDVLAQAKATRSALSD